MVSVELHECTIYHLPLRYGKIRRKKTLITNVYYDIGFHSVPGTFFIQNDNNNISEPYDALMHSKRAEKNILLY